MSTAPDPVKAFTRAEDRVLSRFGLDAERRLLDVAAVEGQARVLIAGDGPPVLMVIGAGPPAALWAPLMARLGGFRLYVVDPPGMGRTDPVRYTTASARAGARPGARGMLVRAGSGRSRTVTTS